MNKSLFLIRGLSFSILLFSLLLTEFVAGYAGDYNGTQSEVAAEMNVSARVSATETWFQVEVDTEEINFGDVKPMNEWDAYRAKYGIRAKGNVNITLIPELVNKSSDNIFSNLYFARIWETSLSKWEKIGNYDLKFNLSEDLGVTFRNAIDPKTGNMSVTSSQSILLNLENYEGIIPFPEEQKNVVKFVAIPDWTSISDPSP